MENRRWHPRISTILLGIVLLPVIGVGTLAYQSVDTASSHRREVSDLNDAIVDLTGALRLGAAVTDEKYWAYASESLDELGISDAIVMDMVGLDPWAEYDAATGRVDEFARAMGADELHDRIRDIRADDDLGVPGREAAYDQIQAAVEVLRKDASDRLVDMPGAVDLSTDIRTLRSAADLRDNAARQMAAFFALQFASSTTADEAMRILIASNDRYRQLEDALVDSVRPGTRAAAVVDDLIDDEDQARFEDEVRASVDQTLANGAAETVTLSRELLFANATALADTFLGAKRAVDGHMRLVDAGAEDVAELAADLDADAAAQSRDAVIWGATVAAVALGGAVLGSRAIIVPLRRMADAADAMREGSLDHHVEESGPQEMRSATRAMNEAVAQLQLAERQALALAQGDLDDPVLEISTPGALGRSLREAVAHLTSSLNDREEFRRRLAHEAAHDPLTGLPNRTASLAHLNRALGRAQRTGDRLAVLMIDLDGFKQVNDLHGHGAGDRVLVQVAQRLSEAIRQSDVVGRLGADEFIVVAEPVGDDTEAGTLAQRLADALEEPIMAGGRRVAVSATIGIVSDDGTIGPDVLIREADAAVVEAKRTGGGKIMFCDDDLRAGIASRSAVERGLADAIENDDLVVYVQQIVDARTEELHSMEALVRWVDPVAGLIPPDDFIPVAEGSDLIVALDRWVLQTAIQHLARWGADPHLRHVPLSVNISGRHLAHPHLVDHVLDPLRAHGVDPTRLTVEVTETALLDDLASAATHLAALRAAGVRVAIDDFGTGYTSLAHLRALPVDIVKIDRSFVSNLARDDERTLIRMIVEVGHLFGLEVVAEGVETASDARELLLLGVDALQGFHYSRPRPATDVLPQRDVAPESQPVR